MAGDEVADRLAHILYDVQDAAMDDLLLQGAEEPLDDALRFCISLCYRISTRKGRSSETDKSLR